MKKQFIVLLFSLIAYSGMSQPCQAYFTTNQDTLNLYMSDASYNTDSTMISVSSWTWTVSGMGMSYTYSVQNPVQAISGLPSGSYYVCLSIQTGTGCNSTYCDSVYVGQQSGCQAYFEYYNNSGTFNFSDYSFTTGGGNIVSWDWTFIGGSPSTSTLQNPVVNYAPSTTPYTVELTITSDLGCTDTYQTSVYYYDSTGNPCINWVDVNVFPVTTIGGNDGAIDLTVNGGTPPYSFSWSNGATTEDIYNVPSGTYTATVLSSDSICTAYTITAYIPEPFDSGNVVVDTLSTAAIDSCLTFVPDTFFISGISTTGNVVTVTWVFSGSGQTAVLWIDYTFAAYGTQVVSITINCDSAKFSNTYMSYIFIHESVGIDEESDKLNVYPNPASEYFNLPEGLEVSKLRILGMDGSLMKEIQNPEKEISIRDIPAGIYIIICESDSGTMNGRITVIK